MNKKQGFFGVKDDIYLIITLLLIIFPISYWYFTAPPPGFCEAQGRIFSKKEIIDILGVYSRTQHGQKTTKGKPSSPLNCCSFAPVESGFWSKMFRIDEGIYVDWIYERSEDSMRKNDPEYKFYHQMIIINNCATELIWLSGAVEKEAH
jgi:hypothetical protein